MKVIDLEKLMNRQREVFKHFIKYNGHEISLLPLLKKYSEEDEENYDFSIIVNYLEMYIKSEIITEKELEKYNQTKKISIKVIEERGREIIETLIENKGSLDATLSLAAKYSKEDGKVIPYDMNIMRKYRNYFISHNLDPKLISQHKLVMELSRRSSVESYDIELINRLLNKTTEQASEFVKAIGLSKESFINLRNVYAILYPANTDDIKRIDEIMDLTYKKQHKRMSDEKLYSRRVKRSKIQLEKLKKILDAYLISDLKDIRLLFNEYGFSLFGFKEALNEAKSANDKILLQLIDQYMLKEKTILADKKEVLDYIVQAREHGINYGNGFRQFTIFDLYVLTNYSIDELIEASWQVYNNSLTTKIVPYLKKLRESRIYDNSEDLFDAINYGYKGHMLTDEEKLLLISYIEQMNWPYSLKLLTSMAKRYIEKDFIIELTDDETIENEINMNKK